jgi:hypothetical protein
MAISTPTLYAATPNWRAGDFIALSTGRSLRVIDTRLREYSDGYPVMVLIVEPAQGRALGFQAGMSNSRLHERKEQKHAQARASHTGMSSSERAAFVTYAAAGPPTKQPFDDLHLDGDVAVEAVCGGDGFRAAAQGRLRRCSLDGAGGRAGIGPGRRALPRTLGAVELSTPRPDAIVGRVVWLDGRFRPALPRLARSEVGTYAHPRHLRHGCPAQLCGFHVAVRFSMGVTGIEPVTSRV